MSRDANSPASVSGNRDGKQAGAAVNTADGWLLDDFAVGDVFFTSPTLQHRACGAAGVVSAHVPVSSTAISSLFNEARSRGVQEPVLFGLVPFDTRRPASLGIPLQTQSAAVPEQKAQSRRQSAAPAIVERKPVPAPEVYGDMVRSALEVFAQGEVNKIVLSRTMDVTLDKPLDYGHVLPDLLGRNAQGYTFALPIWTSEGADAQGVMVGASPELL
ncbi:MAG: chorismate-binding protein, partial [Burkholderiaceae bacterium]